MKRFLAFFSLTLFVINAHAGCLPEYVKKINELSGKMNPPRTTVIANTGAEVVVVSTLASVGMLTIPGIIALPAAAAGAGAYLVYLGTQKKKFTEAKLVLQQAEKGDGPAFKRFMKKITKKIPDADRESVRQAILRLDAEMAFCLENPSTGNTKLIKPKMMGKVVLEEL